MVYGWCGREIIDFGQSILSLDRNLSTLDILGNVTGFRETAW